MPRVNAYLDFERDTERALIHFGITGSAVAPASRDATDLYREATGV